MATQTWWLSFCDTDRPEGQRFLGVAIVDVTDDDAEIGHQAAVRRRAECGHTDPVEPEADWMSAAILKSHATGCNPGGEVQALRIDDLDGFAARDAGYPRHRLIGRAELEVLDS